jgi:hypothetical protein
MTSCSWPSFAMVSKSFIWSGIRGQVLGDRDCDYEPLTAARPITTRWTSDVPS